MKLYYFDRSPNFGDSLNDWLWQRLLPDRWDPSDETLFSGIGTIINTEMPAAARWIVFSSGVGYGGPPPNFGGSNWNIVSVRGPLSASVLGLPSAAAITDGAILLAALPEFTPLPEAERNGVVFVPHFEAERDAAWPEACLGAGIEYVNALGDSRAIVERIRRARLVLAEAMHAAIVADALRVPWVPVVSSPLVSTFKWLDWTQSMNMPYLPRAVASSSTGAALRNAMLWAHDQAHRFNDHSSASALKYFLRRYVAEPSQSRQALHQFGRRVHRRAERALASPRFSAWRAKRDRGLIKRATDDLGNLAKQPGMLSEDRVFEQRLDALTTRLAGLR